MFFSQWFVVVVNTQYKYHRPIKQGHFKVIAHFFSVFVFVVGDYFVARFCA
tara:strand:- start:487 stop:639 length:153 start_codon:yes stop_codon:yes gene_type:complete